MLYRPNAAPAAVDGTLKVPTTAVMGSVDAVDATAPQPAATATWAKPHTVARNSREPSTFILRNVKES